MTFRSEPHGPVILAFTAPPKMFCRECGKYLGRGWQAAPLCAECAPNHSACTCEIQNYDPECPVHEGRDPYDIPF